MEKYIADPKKIILITTGYKNHFHLRSITRYIFYIFVDNFNNENENVECSGNCSKIRILNRITEKARWDRMRNSNKI